MSSKADELVNLGGMSKIPSYQQAAFKSNGGPGWGNWSKAVKPPLHVSEKSLIAAKWKKAGFDPTIMLRHHGDSQKQLGRNGSEDIVPNLVEKPQGQASPGAGIG